MASGSSTLSKPVTSFGPPGSKPVTSFGPAGSKVGVREAGANITREFCDQYPDTDQHSILPNFFGGNITELLEPRPKLRRKEVDQLQGRIINQAGEGHENVVFNMFVSLTRQPDIRPPLLVMRTFEMDTKNSLQLKRKALMSQLPTLDFGLTNTSAENDFVILVKDSGVVFVEVKGSNQDHMVRSADKQLTNVDSIVQCIWNAITGDQKRIIPTIKLLIVPDCTEPSPKDMSPQGSYHVYKDACENLGQRWMEVVEELHQQKSSNPFTPDEFKELSDVLVGVWSAKVVSAIDEGKRKYELKQGESDFSLVEQLKKVDTVVNTGNIRDESQFKLTKDKMNPLTTIIRTGETDIFRSCDDIKLCYLKPPQNEVFTRYKHAIVHSPAGCGKSLLVLFKTLELVNTMEPSQRILIVAPVPHNVRIINCLKSNNVSVEKISQFPPRPSQYNVFLMDTDQFFKVDRDTLMGYDLTKYHLLIDDLQHLELDGGKIVKFHDVGDFVERTYATSVQQENSTYCWVMIDITQGDILYSNDGSTSFYLFMDRDDKKKRRVYSIPIVELSHVMRNTNDIIKLTNQQRDNYVSEGKISLSDDVPFPSSQVGHKVMSRVPVVHKLQHHTLLPGRTETDTKKHFIISRLREELQLVTRPPYSLPLSNVAIIWDDEVYFNKYYRHDVNDFLKEEFGTTTQTIEEQLGTKNDNDIIMDVMEHIMSFESPVVVYVRTGDYSLYAAHYLYKICSRARVLVTVVDVNNSEPISSNNIDTVLWKAHSNNDRHFIKYTCTCEEDWKQCKC